ncbi:MAG: hypothetical protein AAGF07_04470 [Patescibacteria group bacterium]
MLNYKDKITIRYASHTKETIPEVYTNFQGKSILIDETYIRSRLKVLFEQTLIKIDEVIITIQSLAKNSGDRFSCDLSIVSADIDFNIKKTSDNYDSLIHSILDKSIEYVHREKEKRQH